MAAIHSDGEEKDGGQEAPKVPIEVIEAIDSLAVGNTASKEDIESVLKF